MDSSVPQNLEEYSASATTVEFDRPVPLLRGPVPAGRCDDPESGTYVLAFNSAESWAAAYKQCETLIVDQCEEGARIGCAITASNKCKPSWWRNFVGRSSVADLKERERCEVREMEGCLAAAKEKCVSFAKEKCSGPFLDARIAAAHDVGKEAEVLVWLASMPEESTWLDLIGSDKLGLRVFGKYGYGVTNYRARDLLSTETSKGTVLK